MNLDRISETNKFDNSIVAITSTMILITREILKWWALQELNEKLLQELLIKLLTVLAKNTATKMKLYITHKGNWEFRIFYYDEP